jgi:hypothetical protein
VAVPVGTYSADNTTRLHIGKYFFYLSGTHSKVCSYLGCRDSPVCPKISKHSLMLIVEAFGFGNVIVGFPLVNEQRVKDFLQHKIDERAAVAYARTLVDGFGRYCEGWFIHFIPTFIPT